VSGAAIGLVLLSAFAHAGWNFLTKRSPSPLVFTWGMAVAVNGALLPLATALFVREPPSGTGWALIGASWCVHLLYFLALARGYTVGDLSVVYPVARGTGVLLIPVLGVLFLDESMSAWAILAVILIVAGIAVLGSTGLPAARMRPPGVEFALLTGLTIATYSTIDARGADEVNPLLYVYLLTSAGTIGLFPIAWTHFGRETLAAAWRSERIAILAGGLLQFIAYGLVLFVLQDQQVSYVGPFRETALVIGVVLGALFLNEQAAKQRSTGAAIIVVGALTMALAP
jgi:drug/metabolite transporter (DMT)-like permease